MSRASLLTKVGIPVGIIVLSLVVLFALAATKAKPERAEKSNQGVLVEVMTLEQASHATQVRAKGTVIAAQRVMLQPELGGRVTWQSPELIPGGRFEKGKAVLKIDARDYRIAVDARRAELRRARLELAVENRRGKVAKDEWEAFGDKTSESEGSILALRKPQLEAAKVQLKAAQGAVAKAELDLKRTTLKAPFNAMVVSESVDVGQLIGPQTPVATLVGTDTYWVQVSIPVSGLSRARARRGDAAGAKVQITQHIGEQTIEREGEVIRHLPDLDQGGSMARILVAIDDPLGAEGEPQLLLGSYVDVAISSEKIDGAIAIPRSAVRDGNRVFVMNDDNKLEVRQVTTVWSTPNEILVNGGVKPGEQLIVSRVSTPVPNMLLRTAVPEQEQPVPAKQ